MKTLVYIRRQDGSLGAYEVDKVRSFGQAINLVKAETGLDRALAVIEGGKK